MDVAVLEQAGATRPTAGQLALARLLADGGTRANRGITHVDAAFYTAPSGTGPSRTASSPARR
jgi:hypothetical protein